VSWNALLDVSGPLIGVVLGAGLTYLFGTLNRRHQEGREDRTRWYEARFRAYTDFLQAVFEAFYTPTVNRDDKFRRVLAAWGTTRLVSSARVDERASDLLEIALSTLNDRSVDEGTLRNAESAFLVFARRDLGHPPYTQQKAGGRLTAFDRR
jgi:hypothetical protein